LWIRIKISAINYPKIVGIILLAVGIILLLITAIITNSIKLTNENISSISILISISLGLISIGIAIMSIGLSMESDEKMSSIANVYFIELNQQIYNYLSWCEKNENASVTTYHEKNDILEWLIIVKKAIELKKWATQKEIKAFSIGLKFLLKNWLSQWKKGMLTERDRQYIYQIFDFCKEEKMLTVSDTIEVNRLLDELKKEK